MWNWFKTGADQSPAPHNASQIRSIYKREQIKIILGLFFGYAVFYTCRTGFGLLKKPMLDEGVLTMGTIGAMGAAMMIVYAFAKFANGFLADYANIRRFMAFGLLASALVTFCMGFNTVGFLFVVLWGLNGWFQGMGAAPACVSIFQWFQPSKRATYYGFWGGAHNVGEGLTYLFVTGVMGLWGWRAGFIVPALLSAIVACGLLFLLRDRPQTMGLPSPAEAFGEEDTNQRVKKDISVFRSQLYVLKSPVVWFLGIACGFMYISRWAVASWGPMYIQEVRHMDISVFANIMFISSLLGFVGALAAGYVSDKFFKSSRHGPTFIYGVLNLIGMLLLFYGPNSIVSLTIALCLCGSGFAIGGLIVFLAGLNAADLVPKKAVGATKGFLGLLAYAMTAGQEIISAELITTEEINGVMTRQYDNAVLFWVVAAVISIAIAWSVKYIRPAQTQTVKEQGAEPAPAQ